MKPLATAALAAAMAVAWATSAWAGSDEGKTLFEANECSSCHYTDGPARETTIDDQLAKNGPELWYAGDKFQEQWLSGWLSDPKPIRLLKYNSLTEENPGDHPALNTEDSAHVTTFLMSLTSGQVEAGAVTPKKNAKGRQIFTKKMPCSGCHQYQGRKGGVTGGLSGPSLVEAGVRLNPDWILAYMQNPQVFKPIKMMPVFVGLISDKDMKKLVSYVASFEPDN